jgi:hypothetical protein
MVTIVINHVTGVYLIPVKKNLVSVQTHLDVNLDGNMDSRSVIKVYSIKRDLYQSLGINKKRPILELVGE